MSDSRAQYRKDIDGLRAVAILSVVLFHAFPGWLPNGFVGVDIFFVISGYLIGGIILAELAEARFSFLAFYKRRIRRLLPALAVVYVAMLAIGALVLAPADYSTLTLSMRASVLLGSNIFFAGRTGYFDQAASAAPFVHTWSLSVEEQFYLLSPLLLWGLHRSWARATGPILIGLAVLSFGLTVHGDAHYPAKAFFLPHTRAWELLLGVILARYQPLKYASAGARTTLGFVGLVVMVGAMGLNGSTADLFPQMHILLPCLAAVALIEVNRYGMIAPGFVLASPPLVYVGQISYPLYLWHWPLLVYVRMLGGSQNQEWLVIAAVAAAFLLADLTRRWVELPFRFGIPLTTRTIYGGFAAISVVLIAFSLVSETTKGLPQRFSPPIRAVFAAANEWRASARIACREVAAEVDFAERMKPSHPCHMGAAKGPLTVVLWGDSHAAALQPGVDRWLQHLGLSGFALTPPCRPVLMSDLNEAGESLECGALQEALIKRFLDSDATTLLVAMRWNRLVEGVLPLERGYRVIPDAVRRQRAEELALQLHSLAKRISAGGKQLAFIYTVPEIPFNVPNSVGIRLNLGLSSPQGPVTSDVLTQRALTSSAVQKGFQDYDVKIVDPVPGFCQERCRVVHDDKPLYFDNNHLTIEAADIIASVLEAQLPSKTIAAGNRIGLVSSTMPAALNVPK